MSTLAPDTVIQLWRGNRVDQEWSVTVQDLCERYVAWRPEPYDGLFMRDLLNFIGRHDGGLGSACEVPAEQLEDVCYPIVKALRAERTGP